MAERLFFAIWPGTAERRALAALAGTLDSAAGRPTHPLDLHLTLSFLGPVDDANRRCAERSAGGVEQAPFVMSLNRLGYWPGPGILWCGPDRVGEGLSALVAQLTSALVRCGLEAEKRPYRPHVTLIRRARTGSNDPWSRAVERPIAWPVREFVLASGSGGPPPRYQVLRRWPLQV